jgi:hypothetical protein
MIINTLFLEKLAKMGFLKWTQSLNLEILKSLNQKKKSRSDLVIFAGFFEKIQRSYK